MIKTKLLSTLALSTSLFAGSALAAQSEWSIDKDHSQVGFTVDHMVVSEVDGQFKSYSGKALLDDADLTKSQVEFTADVGSVDTGNQKRDEHLRGADFFDAAKYPQLTFKSTKITKAGKGYKLKGLLTLHGVTKEVTLDATVSQVVKNPWGKQVRAVKVGGELKRADFGLTWNKSLDQGGLLIGDTVEIDVKLELNQ